MRLVKVAVGEVNVVGRDQRQAVTIRQLDQARLGARLVGRSVACQLDIEPVRECRREFAEHGLGGFGLSLGEQPPDGAPGPTRQAKQPLTGAGQLAAADGRLARRFAVEIGPAYQPQEVAIARIVLRQQRDAVGLAECAAQPAASFRPAVLDRELTSDDRLHPRRTAGCREFQRAEQIAAVGDRNGRHPLSLAPGGQLFDPDRAGRKRVGGVNAKMNEICERHAASIAYPPPPVSQTAATSGKQPGNSY